MEDAVEHPPCLLVCRDLTSRGCGKFVFVFRCVPSSCVRRYKLRSRIGVEANQRATDYVLRLILTPGVLVRSIYDASTFNHNPNTIQSIVNCKSDEQQLWRGGFVDTAV